MAIDHQELLDFLEPQLRDFGGNLEIEAGLWAVFAVPAGDGRANALVRDLLAGAGFSHDSGHSEDDQWILYYVDAANRPAAVHWLDDLHKRTAGDIRPVSPDQQTWIEAVVTSDRPHRAAGELADLHAQGKITAGLIRDPKSVRALLDRLHGREPLFFAALQNVLAHHLIDLVVLLRQIIDEDVALCNEIVKSGLSADPFLQSRQDAIAAIRNLLVRFQVISPLEQRKNISIANPYAAFLGLPVEGDRVLLSVDGLKIGVTRDRYREAIRAVRRRLYVGEPFDALDTQVPWMTDEIAHPFRFIKQQVTAHREFAIMDTLYMLERAASE